MAILNWTVLADEDSSTPEPSGDEVEKRNVKIDYSEWETGMYQVVIFIDMYPKDVVYENITDENRDELRKNDTERISKEFEFEISTSENAL